MTRKSNSETVAAAASLMLATALGLVAATSVKPLLDYTGTRRGLITGAIAQVTVKQMVTESGSFVTERKGFEPLIRFKPYTAFPVPRLRPLGHLSGMKKCLVF